MRSLRPRNSLSTTRATARRSGFGSRAARERPTADLHSACVGDKHSARDSEQRRLPRAVLAHDGVNLARIALDADVVDSLDGPEAFEDPPQ